MISWWINGSQIGISLFAHLAEALWWNIWTKSDWSNRRGVNLDNLSVFVYVQHFHGYGLWFYGWMISTSTKSAVVIVLSVLKHDMSGWIVLHLCPQSWPAVTACVQCVWIQPGYTDHQINTDEERDMKHFDHSFKINELRLAKTWQLM